jgi:hypothetical protein
MAGPEGIWLQDRMFQCLDGMSLCLYAQLLCVEQYQMCMRGVKSQSGNALGLSDGSVVECCYASCG